MSTDDAADTPLYDKIVELWHRLDEAPYRPNTIVLPSHMTLDQVAYYQHYTGVFNGGHLKMRSELLDKLRERTPAAPPRPLWQPPGYEALMAIPIVVDETMSPNAWKMVNTRTGQTVIGGVEPMPKAEVCRRTGVRLWRRWIVLMPDSSIVRCFTQWGAKRKARKA